jgi:ankyrin repeat protein
MKKAISKLVVFIITFIFAQGLYAQEIFDAIRSGDLAKVKELVERDPQLLKGKNATSSTPLHVAADVDNVAIVKYLIEKGADVHALDFEPNTPLMYAGLETAKILVEKGADINYQNPFGRTVLWWTYFRGKKEAAEYLLDAGAKLPEEGTPSAYDLLRMALRCGSMKFLEKSLRRGLDPLVESEAKNTLLHHATASNSIELVNKLIELGVPLHKANIYGWTSLHSAAYYGAQAVVEWLIKKGSDKNARTIDGKTPYNLADEANKTETANYLKAQGADLSAPKFPEIAGEYFGQPKPGKKAVPFAPAFFAFSIHSPLTFTPDGKEAYWSVQKSGGNEIIVSKMIGGQWTKPSLFSKGDAPFISPDGKKFYFNHPGQRSWVICARDKTPSGWSEPHELPDIVNSIPDIYWHRSVDKKGNLFFGTYRHPRTRIYFSEYKDGTYGEPRLFESSKEADIQMPYIAPDGSYLIFTKFGRGTGTIVFRKKDGTWTEERDINEIVGAKRIGCPIVTHDGRYLFFLSDLDGKSVPFWVDAGFIKEMRKSTLKEN